MKGSVCTLLWVAVVVGLCARAPLGADAPASRFAEIDLRGYANGPLVQPEDGNDLAELSAGLDRERPVKTLRGIPFRLDGLVLVGPGPLTAARKVTGIRIGRKADRLLFLHAAQYRGEPGDRIGSYVVHYEDGSKVEIPIRYDVDVADWWGYPEPETPRELREKIAWVGKNRAASEFGKEQGIAIVIRLFEKSWRNPHPERVIRSLDLVTGDQPAGERAPSPFLVAVTAAWVDATGGEEKK